MAGPQGRRRYRAAAATPAPDGEDVKARAMRLGISEERVLREYARIAFSDIARIAAWNAEGIMTATPSDQLGEDDAPAIAEIVASASSSKVYRIKLHDKKPVLDALARYLELLAHQTGTHEEEPYDEGDDPREVLIRELDRVAAEEAQGSGGQEPEP